MTLPCPICGKQRCCTYYHLKGKELKAFQKEAQKFRKEKTGSTLTKGFQESFNKHIEELLPSTPEEKERLKTCLEEIKKITLKAEIKKLKDYLKEGGTPPW